MAHGLNTILKRGGSIKSGIGSRRIFAPQFKLQVLDSYRNDADCKGNQRATARKYGIHRRQIQKWLQVENNLRNSVVKSKCSSSDLIVSPEARKCGIEMALRSVEHRQRDDEAYARHHQQRSGTAGDASDAVDKRVPDIPQQHSPIPIGGVVYATLQTPHNINEWVHPMRNHSPDDTSSGYSHHSEAEYSPYTNTINVVNPLPLDLTHTRRVAPSPDSPHGATSTTTTMSPSPSVMSVPCIPAPNTPEIVRFEHEHQHEHETTHAIAAPIDLSLKKCPRGPQAPVYVEARITTPLTFIEYTQTNTVANEEASAEIWDLSIKREPTETTNRPIKLFKPYLDHVIEESNPPDIKPIIVSSSIDYDYSNNNNNIDINYYNYNYNYYNDYYQNQIKQRQSYSLDFKLSAIECYYSDAICRGNQRAVASKFKIHRRQVQKWLKQEDQLRQRNDTKPMHIVR